MIVSHSAAHRFFRRCLMLGAGLASSVLSASPLSHAPDLLFHDGTDGLASIGTVNIGASDAARFLAQSTFGATDADITSLRGLGYSAWLTQQFNAAPTYEMDYITWLTKAPLKESIGQGNRQEAWFLGALGGPDPAGGAAHTDQLRQRVAFALSEIFVISDENPTLDGYASGMAFYYDILIRDAFANYRTLLQDVTLNPAMGEYLNMIGNRRADASQNVHPDENYAREINQLFSIGLVMLKADGTPLLDAGNKQIPTYNQAIVTNFAHVFTGWNYATCDSDDSGTPNKYDQFTYCFPPYRRPQDFLTPMVAFDQTNPMFTAHKSPSYHDNGTNLPDDIPNKQLLSYGQAGGGVLANGGTALSDLNFALDNIFNHPNVGPFISKQLIMRLVTSNPTPAYVQRVAGIFNDDGSGVRGNLKAVVQAILLDPEARYGQWQHPDTFGKMREPLLTLTHFWRAMGAKHMCGKNTAATADNAAINYKNQPYRYAGYGTAWSTDDTQYGDGVAQASLDAFTVFNFFKPSYIPSGEMSTRGLLGPEFQINTDSIIANTSNSMLGRSFYYDVNDACDSSDQFGNVKIDHARDAALAGSGTGGSSAALVAAYNTRFLAGQMSPFMQNALTTFLDTITSANGTDWRTQRAKQALYLIFTSPEYMIQK